LDQSYNVYYKFRMTVTHNKPPKMTNNNSIFTDHNST
jgi:hypothetical protein